jgi:hypothetical protein
MIALVLRVDKDGAMEAPTAGFQNKAPTQFG